MPIHADCCYWPAQYMQALEHFFDIVLPTAKFNQVDEYLGESQNGEMDSLSWSIF